MIKDLEGPDAFERSGGVLFNDPAVDIAGVGYQTGLGTSHKIGGVRLSETKGAHES